MNLSFIIHFVYDIKYLILGGMLLMIFILFFLQSKYVSVFGKLSKLEIL